MICDSDPELGGAVQLMGLLRTLIDPENMLAPTNVRLQETHTVNFCAAFIQGLGDMDQTFYPNIFRVNTDTLCVCVHFLQSGLNQFSSSQLRGGVERSVCERSKLWRGLCNATSNYIGINGVVSCYISFENNIGVPYKVDILPSPN